jgi:hypothetical protein
MSQTTLKKLESINAEIQKLEHQKQLIKENLKKSLMKVFDDAFILQSDFETLMGGILNVRNMMSDPSEAAKKVREGWKNEGKNHFHKNKRTFASDKNGDIK